MASAASAFAGFSAGIISGGALCAFYIALGIFSKTITSVRLSRVRRSHILCSAVGVLLGALISLFPVVTIDLPLAPVFGVFSGIYVGLFIGCLADVVSAIPVVKNIGIPNRLLRLVFLAFVFGKLTGSLIYWISEVF